MLKERLKLTEVLRSNKWDLAQPIESLQKKRSKQYQRAAAKRDKKHGAAASEFATADEVAIGPITGDYDYQSVTMFQGTY